MLKDIIKKEILETITGAKFVFTFLLCAILILLSVYTGVSNYRADRKEFSAAVALNKKNLETQPSYLALSGLGTKINRAPQVLSAIATGVDEAVGRVATVNVAFDPNLVDSKYESNAALERDYQAKQKSQERLAINLSRISPASALTFSTMSLARTGLDEHERFLASLRAYKPIFSRWLNSKMMKSLNLQTGQTGKVVLDEMPQHKFEPETLSRSVARTLPDFGLTLFLIIIFFAGAYVSFLKYDVR